MEMKASGLGTAQPHEADSQSLSGQAVFQDGEWKVVFKRGLVTKDPDNDIQLEPGRFIPVAFSAWDGHNGEEGSLRAVSTWYLLYLEPPPSPYRWLQVFAVMGMVGIAEGLLLWWIRRRSKA